MWYRLTFFLALLAPMQETATPEPRALTILVRNGQGQPLRDVQLVLLRDRGGAVTPAADAAGTLVRAQTDATGRHTFRVPWGNYVLQFQGTVQGRPLQPIAQQGIGGAEEACSSQPGFCIHFAERDTMTVRLAIGGLWATDTTQPALPLWDDAARDADPVTAVSAQTGQVVDPDAAAAEVADLARARDEHLVGMPGPATGVAGRAADGHAHADAGAPAPYPLRTRSDDTRTTLLLLLAVIVAPLTGVLWWLQRRQETEE